jgi:hypothetical protein
MQTTDTKPNGPVAAAFIAAGIGALTLGVLVVLADASTAIKDALDFSKLYGLGKGVGPLSGKVAIATVAYIASWIVLHVTFRGRELPWGRVFAATLVLIFAGFAMTFPPIFEFLAHAIKGGG